MSTKTQLLLALTFLGLLDIVIPIPLTVLILVYVIFTRPPWFMELVRGIYRPQ